MDILADDATPAETRRFIEHKGFKFTFTAKENAITKLTINSHDGILRYTEDYYHDEDKDIEMLEGLLSGDTDLELNDDSLMIFNIHTSKLVFFKLKIDYRGIAQKIKDLEKQIEELKNRES